MYVANKTVLIRIKKESRLQGGHTTEKGIKDGKNDIHI